MKCEVSPDTLVYSICIKTVCYTTDAVRLENVFDSLICNWTCRRRKIFAENFMLENSSV